MSNMAGYSDSEWLYFAKMPPLNELCCLDMIVPSVKSKPGETTDVRGAAQPQVIKCRELIFTEPEIIATPLLEKSNSFQIIMHQSLFKSGRLQARFKRMEVQVGRPKLVLHHDLEACLRYTFTAHLAPAWNKVGDILVHGRNFLTSKLKMPAIAFTLTVAENQIYLTLRPQLVKIPDIQLGDLGIPRPLLDNFLKSKPNGKIEEYSICSKWCSILPSMKKGQVVGVSHSLPSHSPFLTYKDMKRYWKNTYGYRLPETDEGIVYLQVYLKLVGAILFTYPQCCVRPRDMLVFPRPDTGETLKTFLHDFQTKVRSVCGLKFSLSTSARQTNKQLTESSNLNEVSHMNLTQPMTLPSRPRQSFPAIPMSMSNSQPRMHSNQHIINQTNISKGPETVKTSNVPGNIVKANSLVIKPDTRTPVSTSSGDVSNKSEKKIVPMFKSLVKRPCVNPYSQKAMATQSAKSVPVFKSQIAFQRHTERPPSQLEKNTTFGAGLPDEATKEFGVESSAIPIVRRNITAPTFKPNKSFTDHVRSSMQKPSQMRPPAPSPGRPSHMRFPCPSPGQPLAGKKPSILNRTPQMNHGVSFNPSTPGSAENERKRKLPTESPSVNQDGAKAKKPRQKQQIKADVDVIALANQNQLQKVNAATLIAWLREKGVSCSSKDKKPHLVQQTMLYLNLRHEQ